MTLDEHFVKTWSNRTYIHTTMVKHKGTVVALAMDNQRRIYYSVLDLDQASENKGPLDVDYWHDPDTMRGGRLIYQLRFPTEIAQAGYAVAGNSPTRGSGQLRRFGR